MAANRAQIPTDYELGRIFRKKGLPALLETVFKSSRGLSTDNEFAALQMTIQKTTGMHMDYQELQQLYYAHWRRGRSIRSAK